MFLQRCQGRICAPHSLFGLAKKRTGRARSKRKKRCAVREYGRSPENLCPRRGWRGGFGGFGHPLRRFPLALRCSVSGARRMGFTSTTSDDRRGVNAGEADSTEKSGSWRGLRGGFGGLGHSLRRFPLALRCSVSGARRMGFTSTTSDDRRGVNAGEADSTDKNGAPVGDSSFGGNSLEQLPYFKRTCAYAQVPRQRFFSWTAPPPVLSLTPQKENGGWNPLS